MVSQLPISASSSNLHSTVPPKTCFWRRPWSWHCSHQAALMAPFSPQMIQIFFLQRAQKLLSESSWIWMWLDGMRNEWLLLASSCHPQPTFISLLRTQGHNANRTGAARICFHPLWTLWCARNVLQRAGAMVQHLSCSFIGPAFSSQHSYGSSQLPVVLMPSWPPQASGRHMNLCLCG